MDKEFGQQTTRISGRCGVMALISNQKDPAPLKLKGKA